MFVAVDPSVRSSCIDRQTAPLISSTPKNFRNAMVFACSCASSAIRSGASDGRVIGLFIGRHECDRP